MKRESFIVYKSFYGLIKLLPEKERVKMFEAIFDFGFDETIPTFKNETSKAIWQSIYPQLNANNRRYENGIKGKEFGKLGGRPKNTDGDKNKTPKETPNPLENKTPNITPNENVNENDNVNVYLSNACAHVKEDDLLLSFLKKYPKLKNDAFDLADIDLSLLDNKMQESDFLKGVTSLQWLVSNYDKVVSGKYKTFKKETKVFENQRSYSKEELDSLIDEL